MIEYNVVIKEKDGTKSIVQCVLTFAGLVACEKIIEKPMSNNGLEN